MERRIAKGFGDDCKVSEKAFVRHLNKSPEI